MTHESNYHFKLNEMCLGFKVIKFNFFNDQEGH